MCTHYKTLWRLTSFWSTSGLGWHYYMWSISLIKSLLDLIKQTFLLSPELSLSLSPAADFPSGSGGEPGCIPWSPERLASGNPQQGNGCTRPRCWCRKRSARWTLSVEEGGSENRVSMWARDETLLLLLVISLSPYNVTENWLLANQSRT